MEQNIFGSLTLSASIKQYILKDLNKEIILDTFSNKI